MRDYEREQQEHIAAGLGEAPSFEDIMDGIAAQAVKVRMQGIIAAGQSPFGGFLGSGSFEVVPSRSAGYRS